MIKYITFLISLVLGLLWLWIALSSWSIILSILLILFSIVISTKHYSALRVLLKLEPKNFKILTWLMWVILIIRWLFSIPLTEIDNNDIKINEWEVVEQVPVQVEEKTKDNEIEEELFKEVVIEEKVEIEIPKVLFDLVSIEWKNFNEVKWILGEPKSFREPEISDDYNAIRNLSWDYFLEWNFKDLTSPIVDWFVWADDINTQEQQYVEELWLDNISLNYLPVELWVDKTKITGLLIWIWADSKVKLEEYKNSEANWSKLVNKRTNENVMLKFLITQSMNDPKSYEHVSTTHYVDWEYIRVNLKFRWNNAFWALVLNEVSANFKPDWTFVEIIE